MENVISKTKIRGRKEKDKKSKEIKYILPMLSKSKIITTSFIASVKITFPIFSNQIKSIAFPIHKRKRKIIDIYKEDFWGLSLFFFKA